jgi:hypothetical protein
LPAVAAAIAVALFASAGEAAADYDPYKVSREKFRRDVRTIALKPLRLAFVDIDGDALSEEMLERVRERLGSKQYGVVPPDEFDTRWRDYSKTLGGIYDTRTGIANPESYRLVHEFTTRELSSELDADAILTTSIFLRAATVGWSRGVLRSVGEPLTWEGETIDFAEGLPNWPQIVSAAWVGIEIRSIDGVVLYDVGCPIAWQAIYMARSREERPEAEVYEETAILDSIDRCLDDLEPRSSTAAREP